MLQIIENISHIMTQLVIESVEKPERHKGQACSSLIYLLGNTKSKWIWTLHNNCRQHSRAVQKIARQKIDNKKLLTSKVI